MVKLDGFQGGMNDGIYEITGVGISTVRILKLVKGKPPHPGLLSEAENLCKLKRTVPQITSDGDVTFPEHIIRVEHMNSKREVELIDALLM